MKLALLIVGLVVLSLLVGGPTWWTLDPGGLFGGLFGMTVGLIGGVFGLVVGGIAGIFGAGVGLLAGLFGVAVGLAATVAVIAVPLTVLALPVLFVALLIYAVVKVAG